MKKILRPLVISLLWLLAISPFVASAHVKWFADWSFADQPTPLDRLLNPIVIGLGLFTMFALTIAVFLDRRLRDIAWYKNIIAWFDNRQAFAPLALRIGLGMTLMLAWAGDRLLTPDLALSSPVWGWFQFVLALLLIFPQTTPLAGVGTLVLYAVGVLEHGAFYMLDYFIFVGVGIYLIVANLKNERMRGLRIPALYFAVGFSLMWVAVEKLIYPQWGLDILSQNPVLTLGLDPLFFLTSAAFIELALGYLLIIGLLERPLSIVITLVFFTTTLIFGKVEVIGHTIIHAALIAFLLEGTTKAPYPAPIDIHRKLNWRMAFAAVNFALLTLILVIPYEVMANTAYNNAIVYFSPLLSLVMR
jgi:uncharacterized membrane protein YphA (DoxX/SURF4 family)